MFKLIVSQGCRNRKDLHKHPDTPFKDHSQDLNYIKCPVINTIDYKTVAFRLLLISREHIFRDLGKRGFQGV